MKQNVLGERRCMLGVSRGEIRQVCLVITESLEMLVPELKATRHLMPKGTGKTVTTDRHAVRLSVRACVRIRVCVCHTIIQKGFEAVKLGSVRRRLLRFSL